MSSPSMFGYQVKQLRQEQGLTQEALAERVGITAQMIRKIEGGQRRPSYPIAAKLADVLEVAPNERARFVRCSRDDTHPGSSDSPHHVGLPAQPVPSTPAPSNLPTPLTRLIGREGEIKSARDLVLGGDVRLLTLIGPGGAGKTRLGIELAAGLYGSFADRIVFVNLAPIHDPALVIPTIADAIGIGEEGGQSRLERLKAGLQAKRMLLVLDNFEQVIPAAAHIADLLSACPGVKMIVTSREVLHVRGERVFLVQPLAVPRGAHSTAGELLSGSPAVQLFAERARAARPDFVLTDENAAAVAELCARLDGLPLAIELAAARSTVFSPEAMLARLGSRLKLLSASLRDLPARQQALRSTIAWSYDLLAESEQALFRRLCVFVGGHTLDAMAVCTAAGDLEIDVVDGLASLLDKSLLCPKAAAGDEPRFLMLETIREFGLEQLERSGEAEATRRAHADYYLQLVERSEPHLWGGAQEQWLEQLEREHDNLRAALAWHIAQGQDSGPALHMAGRLWRFWNVRGHWTEGRRWLEQALACRPGEAPEHRWVALHGAGNLSLDLGEYARAKAYYEESLALTEQISQQRGVANSLLNLSQVSFYQGDLRRAFEQQQESLAIHRALGNTVGIALALHNLATMAEHQGDYECAARMAEESLAHYRDLRDSLGVAWGAHIMGLLAHRRGECELARTLLEESRATYEKLGAKYDLARLLNDQGELALDQGQPDTASGLFEASLRLAAELGDRRQQAAALNNLGRLAHRAGDEEGAVMLCRRSLDLRRDLGDKRGIALTLASLNQIAPQRAGMQLQNV